MPSQIFEGNSMPHMRKRACNGEIRDLEVSHYMQIDTMQKQ